MSSFASKNQYNHARYSAGTLLIGHLVIIDLLFFPYFQYVIMPYSLPVVLVGLLASIRISMPINFKQVLGAIFGLIIFSLIISLILPDSSIYAVENLKRALQFTTSFAYFIYFYQLGRRFGNATLNLKILLAFLIYYCSFSIYFLANPIAANELVTTVYGRLVAPQSDVLSHFRFSYIFTDPNTGAYFLLIATLPLLPLLKSRLSSLMAFMAILVAVLISQSRGGLLAMLLGTMLWLIHSSTSNERIYSSLLIKAFLAILMLILGLVVINKLIDNNIFGDTLITDYILYRLTDQESIDIGSGSRITRWLYYISELIPLPFGRGYIFNVDSADFNPHSDLLRLIYSYGFIVAPLFIYLCFRHILRIPLIIVPAVVAFGINTLIDEQKLFALFLSLLGMYYSGVFNGTLLISHKTILSQR